MQWINVGSAVVLAMFMVTSPWVSASSALNDFSPRVVVPLDDEFIELDLSGQVIRKKLFFDIYHIAHYMPWSRLDARDYPLSQAIEHVLSGEYPQQIDIVFQRDIKAEKIREVLEQGIRKNSSRAEFEAIANELARFKQAIDTDIPAQAHLRLRWLPSDTLIAYYQDRETLRMSNPLFARLLWSVWFGQKAVVNKEKLLANVVS